MRFLDYNNLFYNTEKRRFYKRKIEYETLTVSFPNRDSKRRSPFTNISLYMGSPLSLLLVLIENYEQIVHKVQKYTERRQYITTITHNTWLVPPHLRYRFYNRLHNCTLQRKIL